MLYALKRAELRCSHMLLESLICQKEAECVQVFFIKTAKARKNGVPLIIPQFSSVLHYFSFLNGELYAID